MGPGGQPANGIVDAFDVVGAVDRFKSILDAPPQTWWDLHANRPPQGVNFNIDALDITLVVDAFQGSDDPYPGPSAPGSMKRKRHSPDQAANALPVNP